MTRTLDIIFPSGRSPERLDRFLDQECPDLSRSQLKRLIDDGQVRVDGQPAKAGLKLKGGEVLRVEVPPPAPLEAQPEAIDIPILYQDADLVVIDKPAGLVVHPAAGHGGGTLVNALLHHCGDLAGVGGALRPGIVHRLDKDTSGVMVVAKNDAAHQHLAAQFKAHTIERRYVALVHGVVQCTSGSVDRPIGRHTTQRKKMSSQTRAGRRAVTHWTVQKRYDRDRLTLVELRLETGRTHQIRVHFSEMNLPLVADPVYGAAGRSNSLTDNRLRSLVQKLSRQFLHARSLGFIHPRTGETLRFDSPLPPELQTILDYLDAKYAALDPAAKETTA